jgi:hypothetical protein
MLILTKEAASEKEIQTAFFGATTLAAPPPQHPFEGEVFIRC